MKRKYSGHYFCDPCDDLAFGECCQTCHQPARWIPHTLADRTVSAETAADYFRRMHAAVNATPVFRK
jgi:hypothetical protein